MIITISLSAHTRDYAMRAEESLVCSLTVVNSLIRMVKKEGRRSSPLDSPLEGQKGGFLMQFLVDLPPSHFPGIEVHDRRKAKPPVFCGDIGDIGAPDAIWSLGLKFSLKEIEGFLEGMSRIGGYSIPSFPWLHNHTFSLVGPLGFHCTHNIFS